MKIPFFNRLLDREHVEHRANFTEQFAALAQANALEPVPAAGALAVVEKAAPL